MFVLRHCLVVLLVVVCAMLSKAAQADVVVVSASYYFATGKPRADMGRYDPNDPTVLACPWWAFKKWLLVKYDGREALRYCGDRMPDSGPGGENEFNIDMSPAGFRQFADMRRGRMDVVIDAPFMKLEGDKVKVID